MTEPIDLDALEERGKMGTYTCLDNRSFLALITELRAARKVLAKLPQEGQIVFTENANYSYRVTHEMILARRVEDNEPTAIMRDHCYLTREAAQRAAGKEGDDEAHRLD